ncbi:MAG: hypothetical protein ACT4PE_06840 [Candidatus Eiseniibacteriota bacterium]
MTFAGSRTIPPLAALLFCGCSLMPGGSAEPDPGEPPLTETVPADTTSIAAADSTVDAAQPVLTDAEPVPVEEPAPASDPEPVPAVPAPDPPAERVVAEAGPAEPLAPVQVELSAEERLSLATEARKDLELAEQALRSEDPDPPGAERREKLDTIRNLIDSAKAAYSEDLRAAATLAHKARLLAEELSGT